MDSLYLLINMLNREKKPSEFGEWKKYVAEKQMKYFWRDKMLAIVGEFPKICPLAVPEELGKLYKPTIRNKSGVYKLNGKLWGECGCSLYEENKDKGCECWYNHPPSEGRCDCFVMYWTCSLFRKWLKIKEINVVIK